MLYESEIIFSLANSDLIISTKSLLPPQGFRLWAKSRGGTLVTRAYVKDSTYSSNIQSV